MVRFLKVVAFETVDPQEQVARFYDHKLVETGWERADGHYRYESATPRRYALKLRFAKGGTQQFQVTLSVERDRLVNESGEFR